MRKKRGGDPGRQDDTLGSFDERTLSTRHSQNVKSFLLWPKSCYPELTPLILKIRKPLERTMYRANQIKKVLELLAKNVETKVRPELVDSAYIANVLNLSISETKQIITTMNEMGVIESNMEADYSLITRAGLNRLDS